MGAVLGVQTQMKASGYIDWWPMCHALLEYRQRSMVTIPLGFSSNTPLHDTWSNFYREIGWGVIHVKIVWLDLGDVQLGDV